MWPTPLRLTPDVEAHLALLGAVAAVFVVAVLLALLGMRRWRRRAIRVVTCPEDDARAMIAVQRAPDHEDHVIDCSRWHDGRLACGERCIRPG